jgi:hypothetical protein
MNLHVELKLSDSEWAGTPFGQVPPDAAIPPTGASPFERRHVIYAAISGIHDQPRPPVHNIGAL